jgi:triacylglycerol lipase
MRRCGNGRTRAFRRAPAPLAAWTAALAALAVVLAPQSSASPGDTVANMPSVQGPAQSSPGPAIAFDKANPGHAPAGANDFSCKPTSARPYPVLLAHGTDATAYADFAALAPYLRAQGYCVFVVNYGAGKGRLDFSAGTGEERPTYGTADIRLSAAEIGAAVTRIMSSTGAAKVHLAGFSQGANVTRYYVNRLGGAPVTATWTGIASPTYGGQFYGTSTVANASPAGHTVIEEAFAPALVQQLEGSSFLAELNAGGDTVPGVRYTTISSRLDEVVQPQSNMLLRGPGAQNLFVQDVCPVDLSGHFGLTYSPTVRQLIVKVLDPQAPEVRCEPVPPGRGFVETVIGNNS